MRYAPGSATMDSRMVSSTITAEKSSNFSLSSCSESAQPGSGYHVIASQCAHWRGNLLVQCQSFKSSRKRWKAQNLTCAYLNGFTNRKIIPGDCHVASLLAMTSEWGSCVEPSNNTPSVKNQRFLPAPSEREPRALPRRCSIQTEFTEFHRPSGSKRPVEGPKGWDSGSAVRNELAPRTAR